ncbi:MAG: aspartate aminotransferase family protein [Gammaproteobacteria bacterium]|jgi:putrescine aminotransferase|nr:aspartate aminotransferase family protein [Gammaproteobacteria bacterium]MDH3847761.1 aspartate aminotransferase family protein [Gammaproteobacteria bacterium]MDH3862483.1 aspartate aminotransferase family protein [Gammaproteobacteria bacterium]MDH3905575.1 aspartate aminotransferase family protein [Gammaproteobacteria bacterium]MDH3908116.1 aspartate aminotransferase family protein [Gammaproteobacteria bacterium]
MAAIEKRSRQDWQELDKDHHLHPFTDHKALHEKRSRIITRAEGSYIFDADGNRILDGMSGLWCVNVGYGQQSLIDAATRQLQELPYYNNFFQCAHPPSIELASILQEISQPQFNRVFFAGSGSESNDTVVRMVRTYWDLMGQPQRHTIISRKNAYHGSTVAAASLGGMKPMHRQSGLPIPGIEHIDQPYWFGSDRSLSPDEFGLATARALEEKIREIGTDKVAAFIGEPVQGAGGVIIPPDTYWPEIQRICDEYGILLISDEVITGFGRLGEWFGADHFGTRPDLMPFAKGVTSGYLPLGGVLVGDRVADVMIEKGGEFFHGYTYSGHPAACAVAIANIRLIQEEGLVGRVKNDIGPYLQERWHKLGEHPLVGDTRMIGLMGALELVADKETLERFPEKRGAGTICRDMFLENGLVLRAVGDTMVCAPPLVLKPEEADELVDTAWKCLDLTAEALAP